MAKEPISTVPSVPPAPLESITAPPRGAQSASVVFQPESVTAPRTVLFAVDRDNHVPAEVLGEHSDGSLDLRGQFRQPYYKEVDLLNEEEKPSGFQESVLSPDSTLEIRLRVRKADEEDARRGRPQPGTWFEASLEGT